MIGWLCGGGAVLLVANVGRLEDELKRHRRSDVAFNEFAMQSLDAYRPEGQPILVKLRVRLILAMILGTVSCVILMK